MGSVVGPVVPRRPPVGVLFRRGLLRQCPWCGDRKGYFTGWFSKQDRCRRCGTPWRRGDVGFELGAATVNTIITFGILVVGIAVALIATAPDIPVLPIVLGLVAGAIVIPIVMYPSSYTIWQAFNLATDPPEPGELADHREWTLARDERPGRRTGHRR